MANVHARTVLPTATCEFVGPGETCAKCGVRLFSICGALDMDDLVQLDRMTRHITIASKTLLFEQGAPATHVYSVTSGVILLFKLLPDGRRQVVGFALPGDFLGLTLSETNAFGAEVVGGADLCQFERSDISKLAEEHPKLLQRLHEFVSHELVIAQDQLVILGRLHAEERVVAFLLNMYERYARINRKSVTIPLPMLRADIADYLGLTVETVSRTISHLGREKIILVVPDGVRILDMDRLRKLAR